MKYDVIPKKAVHVNLNLNRKVRRQQLIAKSIIWLAAALTLSILIIIVGFIVINGFIATPMDRSKSLAYGSETVYAEGPDSGFILVVNKTLRLNDLTYEDLRDIYSGKNKYWGFLSGQNLPVRPIILGLPEFYDNVYDYLLIDQDSAGNNLIQKPYIDIVWETIKSEKGGIALVPSEYIGKIPRGLKTIKLRELSLVVHPEITELKNGRRLSFILTNQQTDRKLMNGEIKNWLGISGFDLPVNPVVFADTEKVQTSLFEKAWPDFVPSEKILTADSISDFAGMLETREGTVGVIRTREAIELGLNIMESRRRQIKLNLRPSFLVEPPSRAGAVGGISSIIINTLVMIVFVLAIATPVGVGAAIYLVEYAREGLLLRIFRLGTETLAGIPSIIFGLFGLVFFSQFMGLKTGLVSGALTLTLMILPTIIRTSEEALKSVPKDLKEGSMALGATKLQTIFRIIIPTAVPGIATGVILGMGRAIGETAAILFTMGSNMSLIKNLNSPIRVLSVHLYLLIRENISMENAFATATMLVIIVFLVNFVTRKLIGRFSMIQ